MTSCSMFALILGMISLPSIKAYKENFCLMDLCSLEQEVREACPELSGDEFICTPFQEQKNKLCKFECRSAERSNEETMFILRSDNQIYYCNTSIASPEVYHYIDSMGFELRYLNCNLFKRFNELKLTSKKDSNQDLAEFKRKATDSCIIRLNLYSVYYT
jgi:hypothetical protein